MQSVCFYHKQGYKKKKKQKTLSFAIFGLDPLFHKAFIQKVCANLKTILASLKFCDQ